MRRSQRRGRQRARGVYRSRERGMFPYDLATGEFGPAPEGVEGAQRPRRRHGARHVVRRRVPAGLVPEIGRADGLRRRVRPRQARHGAGAAGVLRARRPRQLPRRRLVGAHLREVPCPKARMASQEVNERLEHVDDPLLTAHRTLPLVGERTWRHTVHCHSVVNVRDGTFRGEWQRAVHCHSASSVPHRYDQGRVAVRLTLPLSGERTGRHVQGRVAVPPSLPLGIERTVSVRSGSSGSASGTFGGEWQCDSHCHSVVSVPGSAPYTATRRRACRISTIRTEWQCLLAGTDSEPAAVTPIGEWPNWANALGQPPAKPQGVTPEPAGLGLGPGRTERRSLSRGPR